MCPSSTDRLASSSLRLFSRWELEEIWFASSNLANYSSDTIVEFTSHVQRARGAEGQRELN